MIQVFWLCVKIGNCHQNSPRILIVTWSYPFLCNGEYLSLVGRSLLKLLSSLLWMGNKGCSRAGSTLAQSWPSSASREHWDRLDTFSLTLRLIAVGLLRVSSKSLVIALYECTFKGKTWIYKFSLSKEYKTNFISKTRTSHENDYIFYNNLKHHVEYNFMHMKVHSYYIYTYVYDILYTPALSAFLHFSDFSLVSCITINFLCVGWVP